MTNQRYADFMHCNRSFAYRLTIQRAPPPSHLEVVKFVCKEFFLFVYARQIDNLRTNHRVSTVLSDNMQMMIGVKVTASRGPSSYNQIPSRH